jgi:hypothetical protein
MGMQRMGLPSETWSVHVVFSAADGSFISSFTTTPTTIAGAKAFTRTENYSIPANCAFWSVQHRFTTTAPLSVNYLNYNLESTSEIEIESDLRAVVWPSDMVEGFQSLAVNGKGILAGNLLWLQNTTPVINRGGTVIAASAPPNILTSAFPDADTLTGSLSDAQRWNVEHGVVTLIAPVSSSAPGGLEAQYWTERDVFSVNPHFSRSYVIVDASENQNYSLKVEVAMFYRTKNPWLQMRARNARDVSDEYTYAERNFRHLICVMPNKSHWWVLTKLAAMLKAIPRSLTNMANETEQFLKVAKNVKHSAIDLMN